MSNQFRYYRDSVKTHDTYKISYEHHNYSTIGSSISIYNDDTGELIFEDLHNRTVIAGSALLAQKMCGLDPSFLNNTPTYNSTLGVDNDAPVGSFPTIDIVDSDGNVIGSYRDETQRKIIGFMVGDNGCGVMVVALINQIYLMSIMRHGLSQIILYHLDILYYQMIM